MPSQINHSRPQGTTTTWMTPMTRATRRRSGPTSAVWLSSHRSSWTRPPRYWNLVPAAWGCGLGSRCPHQALLPGFPPAVPGSPVLAGTPCAAPFCRWPLSGCARRRGPAVWPGAEWATAHGLHGPEEGPLGPWKHATPEVSNSFVLFPDLEARVFATFWLDHPTAEGGIADPEAEKAAADAEGEKPIAPDDPEQAADALPEAGAVHPLQPRRDEQQPQLRREEAVPDRLQPDPHQR